MKRKDLDDVLIITIDVRLKNSYLLPGLKVLNVWASIDKKPKNYESSCMGFGYSYFCFDYKFYIGELMMELLNNAIRTADGSYLIIRRKIADGAYRVMYESAL